MADDAGALLVRSGLVSSAALDEARAKVADEGGTIGEVLVAAGAVDDEKLTDFYKQRLLVPQVNPNTLARLPAKIVAVIPSEMAIELRAIPVSLDNDNNLTVAMSDPSNRHAVDEISFFTGSYVVRAVATQMQIAWCLAHYYGHVTALGEHLLQPASDPPRDESESQPHRTRGITGEIQAARHRAIVPGEAFAHGTAADSDPPPDKPAVFEVKPRSKTVSGEIRVSRAPSIKPPLPDDSGPVITIDVESGPTAATERPSEPTITIEADVGGEYEPVIAIEANQSKPVPKRRRPAEPDPPELAARAGEVQLATGQPIKKIEFDEPRIIISEDFVEDIARPQGAPLAATEPQVATSGEVDVRTHDARGPSDDDLASIFVELGNEGSAPVLVRDGRSDRSEPVLLDRRRPSDAPTRVSIAAAPAAEIRDDLSEPIELPTKRPPPAKRKPTSTQVGVGVVSAITRSHHASGDGAVPSEIDDAPTDARRMVDTDPTRVDTFAAPPRDDDTSEEHLAAPPGPYAGRDTSPYLFPPARVRGAPPPSGHVRLDRVKRAQSVDVYVDDDDTAIGKPTAVMSAVELDDVIPDRNDDVVPGHLEKRRKSSPPVDDLDDDWGPPGTTIPPPLLGAIPGAITPASGIIPIPDIDSAPLIIAPPTPPERSPRTQSVSEAGLAHALEEATARVLELIHTLDHTTNRDQIIAVMIAHLAESHRRAGFFAMRASALSLFAIIPRVAEMPTASLRLDRPSTLSDVVGTRLPYRGPMLDDISRAFLTATLGACPPEILLVPITVRERVVGVLFGDQRNKHTFDDQLALAARAAGMALERLLKAKRG